MREVFNYRYWVLIALVGASVILFFTELENASTAEFIGSQIAFKAVAILLIYMAGKLVDYWNPKGKIDLLAKLTKHIGNLVEK